MVFFPCTCTGIPVPSANCSCSEVAKIAERTEEPGLDQT